jgi:hypothetical protein
VNGHEDGTLLHATGAPAYADRRITLRDGLIVEDDFQHAGNKGISTGWANEIVARKFLS